MDVDRDRPVTEIYDPKSEAMAKLLEQVAWLMDRAIPIPGTNFRIGLDAIIGLLPGGGDFLAGLVQTGLVLTAVKHYHVPKVVAARMAANVLIDVIGGSLPFLGDIWDAHFKANTRNIALLQEFRDVHKQGKPMPTAASGWYLAGIAAVLIGTLVLMFAGLVALAAFIWKRI